MEPYIRFTIEFNGLIGLCFPERYRQRIIPHEDGGIIFASFHFFPAQYFSKEFKKVYGVTPKIYQNDNDMLI